MKVYKESITLNRNSRGCYILDTVKGCPGWILHGGRGCYGDCYAKNIANRYGFDFDKYRIRRFEKKDDQLYLFGLDDREHTNRIIREIKNADMPFVRIGEMGDPSVDWGHTLNVCNEISGAGKGIVIITKHWKTIPDIALKDVSRMGLCINTSISALDTDDQIEHRLSQFERLRNVCNSVLRIVSCDFNREHAHGLDRSFVQEELFKQPTHIDTVFRPSNKNYYVMKNIIKTKKVKFMRSFVLASVYNKNAYLGMCSGCPDICGIAIKS